MQWSIASGFTAWAIAAAAVATRLPDFVARHYPEAARATTTRKSSAKAPKKKTAAGKKTAAKGGRSGGRKKAS